MVLGYLSLVVDRQFLRIQRGTLLFA
jgi:hypothetical protein